jgi:putative transposase
VLKAFKYRIYPTASQVELIHKHMGACRFVYNLALEVKQAAYAGCKVHLSCFDLIKQLPDLKKECPWLKEINSQSLQQAIVQLDTAFTRFFKGQGNFPRFKKKTGKQSFQIPQNIVVENDRLVLPKFKEGILIVVHRPLKGTVKQAAVSCTSTGKYFVSVLCDTGEVLKPPKAVAEKTTVSIDLGIKAFVVTSEGKVFDHPRFLQSTLSKLKFTQRKHSKHQGRRTRKRLARLHEKVANQRRNFLHQTSAGLIKNHDSIALEDLYIKGMVQNHRLARPISDSAWRTFVDMLQYKAAWQGKNILRIGRFEPSSKTCSSCGSIHKDLTLSDREWSCESCGAVLDRDQNAALNIKNFALKNHLSVERRRKTRNELPTLVGVLTSEAHTFKEKGSSPFEK